MAPGLLTRRAALGLLSCLAARPAFASDGDAEEPVYLSAYRDAGGGFGVAVLHADGRVSLRLPLPARGHGAVARPFSSQAVAIARRPGTFALVFDLARASWVRMVHAAPGRHFYGHGAFSPDGRLFYATENDIDGERGVIGLYDAADGFRRVGEHESYGIGPHELILMPDGATLAVANGGILTHPDFPRLKLNLAEMRPSIAFIDRRTGGLIGQVRPPEELRQLSLRHLAASRAGTVALAAQWEGSESAVPPLVGLVDPGGPLRLVSAPAEVQVAMRHYCGAVAFTHAGDRFAVSAPRGDLITYWTMEGRFGGSERLTDGCGLAPHGEGTIATSGEGVLRAPGREPVKGPLAWDNHLTLAG